MYTVMNTMKMSGPLNSNGKPLCTIAKTNILENANNAIKIGKFKIAHGD